MDERWTVTKRLGRTTDGRLVDYYSPEAAFLAYRPGDEIPLREAIAAGLLDDVEPDDGEAPETDEPEEEQAESGIWPSVDEPDPRDKGDDMGTETRDAKTVPAPENKMVAGPEDTGVVAPPEVKRGPGRPKKRG